ncbi:MAG: hypothetical protein II038_16680 [Lachnospiraceae bacterium]|nr:hypothetical protein [Lachnospiraceae bacterium]
MKYYIRMTNKQTGKVSYKRYKCIAGFDVNKDLCWKFSKNGATAIIERLKREYHRNLQNLTFELEPAEE